MLVDEYQDTNALQDAIYFALARSEGDNLFFVGDIKQSIYRFRQADPQVFVDKQQALAALPPAGTAACLAGAGCQLPQCAGGDCGHQLSV